MAENKTNKHTKTNLDSELCGKRQAKIAQQ